MVARSCYFFTPTHRGIIGIGRRLSDCAVYLYYFLKKIETMDKQKQPNTTETLLVLVLACIVGYLCSHQRACLYVGIALGATALFVPFLANFIAQSWLKIGTILGNINGKIILSLIFFLFLVPIALLRRFFSKTNSMTKQHPNSMFITRNHIYRKADLENIW